MVHNFAIGSDQAVGIERGLADEHFVDENAD